MPRKKELPVPESGEQNDLLSAETQELSNTPLPEPQEEPIPTESPPDEGAPEDDTPPEEYTEFLQALNEAPAQEEPQPPLSDEAEPMSAEEPALTIPAEELSRESVSLESPSAPHNGAVLTITARTRIKSEAEATDELWHEIRNAYRTRRILTGTLDGIEQTTGGKTLATVSFRGFRIAIPIREMLVLEERMPSGRAYADYMNRLNRILGTMLGAEIDFIVKGIDSTTHSAVAPHPAHRARCGRQNRRFAAMTVPSAPLHLHIVSLSCFHLRPFFQKRFHLLYGRTRHFLASKIKENTALDARRGSCYNKGTTRAFVSASLSALTR